MPRLISLFDVQPILKQLQNGHLILTPNQRLASRVTTAYGIWQRSGVNGKSALKAVDSPRVYALNTWIEQCWRELLISADPIALEFTEISASQELLLWEQIVAESEAGAVLLRPSATAQQAASAYRTLTEWQQNLGSMQEQFSQDEDSSILMSWMLRFNEICARQHWLPAVRKAEKITRAFEIGSLPTCGTISLLAFDDIAPVYQNLLAVAGETETVSLPKQAENIAVVACESSSDEMLASAVWAKNILRNDSRATVGIVVPELSAQRQVVQRVFQEVFETGYNDCSVADATETGERESSGERRNLPFNLSAGYPLAQAPVIEAALNALSLQLPSLDVETLVAISQSPFYCMQNDYRSSSVDTEGVVNELTDRELGSRLISLIHAEQRFSLSGGRFRQLADKVSSASFSEIAGNSGKSSGWEFSLALQQQATIARAQNTKANRSARQWISHFKEMLSAIGWPGKRRLDSIEYQQVKQWQASLEELSGLSVIFEASNNTSGAMSCSQAISHLRSLLARRIFQPQTVDSPLQVLGTLEAGGLQFSHLWLQSMSENQWPAAPSPNTLLPLKLQRSEAMPHANAERELTFAKTLSDRFLSSADHVVISYSQTVDENPAQVSELFSQFPTRTLMQLLKKPLQQMVPRLELMRRHIESTDLESVITGPAPKLSKGEKVRGGASLFASQSACPFRAFAAHRLGLKALAQPELGLNAADRGTLVHRALEFVWTNLKNRDALMEKDDDSLQTLCAESSSYAVREFAQRNKAKNFGVQYQLLESERLTKLLVAWVEVEKDRADFSIEALEYRQQFSFKELQLETRIDRVDRLADGSLVVIDYKTGLTNINRWWGERPDEPQLPLYSMLADDESLGAENLGASGGAKAEPVAGIAFAQLRVDGCSFKGVGDEKLYEFSALWEGKIQSEAGVENWQQLKGYWVNVLTALAEDFINGKVAVDPKKRPLSCQYCDFSALCRIDHREMSL